MTAKTTPNEKVRALFLATLMVLSVFAMSAAFAGSAAANVGNVGATSADDVMIEQSSVNGTITLEDVTDDGDGDTITIATSTLGTASVNGVSVESDEFTGSATATLNGADIDVTVPAEATTGNITLDVDYDTTGVSEGTSDTVAVTAADGGLATDVTIDYVSNVAFDDFSAPSVSYFGQDIIVSAELTNNGNEQTTEDVEYWANGADDYSTSTVVASQSETLAPGESTTVQFQINTANVSNGGDLPDALVSGNSVDDIYHGLNTNPTVSGALKVGIDQEGSITTNIQDGNGNDLTGANVRLYLASDWTSNPGSDQELRNVTLGSTQSTVTFDNLALGDSSDSNSHVEYVLYAEKDTFNSDSTQESLHYPNNDGPTRTLTLQSTLDAQQLEIVRWDEEAGQPIPSDQGSLLADGNSENNQTFAVLTQNQVNESISGTLPVSLDISGAASDLSDTPQGVSVGDFVDNDTLDRTSGVTIDGADSVAIENNFDKVGEGTVSYATFEVTADNATRDWLEANDLDPIASQPFNASATNETTTLNDDASVAYFLQGDKSTQHQVVDTDGNPVEGAEVWVAYENAPQELSSVETIRDTSGEAFLMDETNENGIAVIDGIIGTANTADPAFNVYVQEDGYNIFNSSTAMTSTGSVLATETSISADYFVADYEVSNSIGGSEGSGEDDVYSHVLRETPQAFDLNVTVADEGGDFVKSTTLPDTNSRQVQIEVLSGEVGEDPADFTPAENQTVDLELIRDSGVANLADTTVETNGNGVATTMIGGVQSQTGVVNITASITNADNTEYRTDGSTDSINALGDQAEVEVVTTGNIEGDVIDSNQEQVPGAQVDLLIENSTGAYVPFEGRTVTTGSDGSFTFQDVPTGENYRVSASFTDAAGNTFTGFNQGQLTMLPAGTTTAGISLDELELDDVPTDWYAGYVDNNDVVTQDGLNDAIGAYLNNDLSGDQLNAVVSSFLNNEPITVYTG